MPTMTVTIYHNPSCGTSRVIVEYLKHPPDRARLRALADAMRLPVRALLREKGTPYAELDLGNSKWTDDQLLDFMLSHPILIQRPIVETPKGVRICPAETVLELLDSPVASGK